MTKLLRYLLNILLALVFWMAFGVCLFTIGAFFGVHHWLLDLMSHFRLAYVWVLGAALIVMMMARYRVAAWMCLIGLIINLATIWPLYISSAPEPAKMTNSNSGSVTLTLLQTNVWVNNEDYQRVANYVNRLKPDLWAMEEYYLHHHLGLSKTGIFKQYPYSIRDLGSGNVLYSRYPMSTHIAFSPENNNAILVAHLAFKLPNARRAADMSVDSSLGARGGGDLRRDASDVRRLALAVVHPERPSRGAQIYRMQLDYFMRVLNELDPYQHQPVVIMGDFNTTPWSYSYRLLTQGTGLHDAAQGFGLLPTFPNYFPKNSGPKRRFPLPIMPIDHVLVNDQVQVLDYQVGPDIGSDHLPVITRISF